MELQERITPYQQELRLESIEAESYPFLRIDDRTLSMGQVLRYLESSGRLESLLWEIMSQHVIDREGQIELMELEQAIIDFRLNNQLTNSDRFQQWLTSEELDYTAFRNRLFFKLRSEKLERLKAEVAGSQVQEYFIERKLFLDRVVLSRLVVGEQALAQELKSQILEDGTPFEQLVQEHSIAGDRIVNGMMGAISRGSLPEFIRTALDLATPGELTGPLEMDGLWYLIRYEKFLPSSFDETLKKELEEELLERWLEEKIQTLDVQFLVSF